MLKGPPVNWKGELRAPLSNQTVYPPVENGPLKTWVAVGGSPESVVRAAHYGLPLMLAIIGGNPQRFVGYAELYKQMLERFGKPMLPIGVHSPGHVAATDEEAKEELWPHYAGLMNRIGAERGWQPIGRAHFEREAADGALFVGAPGTVAAKIVKTVKARQDWLLVQAALQDKQVRVTGKNKDDLQAAMALFRKEADRLKLDMQFTNFRD